MDIVTNELTRHFKIPHKKRGSPEAEVKYGSTMADPHDSREFSQRDIKVMKMRHKRRHDNDGRSGDFTVKKFKSRDATVAHAASPCPSSSPAPMPSTSDPLALVDRICGEMTNRVKREKKERWDESPEKSGPCRTLTKEALERHAQDDTMAREFTRRESLMERLLGHKMLFGRVESYTSMGYIKVDPIIDRVKGRRDSDDEETGGPSAAFRRGPRTPPLPQSEVRQSKQRGPKTPPGSPGPRTPPPPPADDMSALLSNVAAIAGTTDQQLQSYLGEDLSRAMGNVDKNVLLETLKNALRTVGQAQMPSTPTKIDQERAKPSPPKPKKDHDNSSVKMELVSECSLSPPPSFPPVSCREAPLLEAPPPPPVIAPPPPPPNLPIFVPFGADFSAPPMPVTQPFANGQVVTTTVNPPSDYIVPPPKFPPSQTCSQQLSGQMYPPQGLPPMPSVTQQSLPLGLSPLMMQNQAPPTLPGGQQLSGPPPFMNIPPPALNMNAQGSVAQSQPNVSMSISNAPPALPISMRHPLPSGSHSISLPPPLPSALSQPPPPLPNSVHSKNIERSALQIPNVSVPPPTLPPPSELPIVRVKIKDNSPLYSSTKGFVKDKSSQGRISNWQDRMDDWKNEAILDSNDVSCRDPSVSNSNSASCNIRSGLLPSNNTISRGGMRNPGGPMAPICSQLGMRGSHSITSSGPSAACGAPSTQNVTSTLLSALGIGPSVKQTQPPPPEPPVLLDRYGCPLPVPGSRPPFSSLGESSPTNGPHAGHRGNSNHSNRAHPGPPRPLLSVGVSGVVRRGPSNEQRTPRKGGRPYKPSRD